VSLLTIDGDLAGDAVLEAGRRLHGPVTGNVVVDLGGCRFIDSAGLELLCRTRRRCEAAGRRFELARVGASCRQILDLTRLAGRFDCHADLGRALAAAG
jgi:anti-anti-sigma factor